MKLQNILKWVIKSTIWQLIIYVVMVMMIKLIYCGINSGLGGVVLNDKLETKFCKYDLLMLMPLE